MQERLLQVALVAINLHGEKADSSCQNGNGSGMASPLSLMRVSLNSSSQTGSGIGVDSLTAREIQQLVERKHAAVQAENYDEAKELKAEVDSLRILGSKILELEHRCMYQWLRPAVCFQLFIQLKDFAVSSDSKLPLIDIQGLEQQT